MRRTIWTGSQAESEESETAQLAQMDFLPPPEQRKRDRSWDRAHAAEVESYRGVPQPIKDEVTAIAGSLNVPVGEVARVFLEYGLAHYPKDIVFSARMRRRGGDRMTLYPTNAFGEELPGWSEAHNGQPPQVAPARSKKKAGQEKEWQSMFCVRGIPRKVKSAVAEIAVIKAVPKGEVASAFLIYALNAYRSGRLLLVPHPRTRAALNTRDSAGSEKTGSIF